LTDGEIIERPMAFPRYSSADTARMAEDSCCRPDFFQTPFGISIEHGRISQGKHWSHQTLRLDQRLPCSVRERILYQGGIVKRKGEWSDGAILRVQRRRLGPKWQNTNVIYRKYERW